MDQLALISIIITNIYLPHHVHIKVTHIQLNQSKQIIDDDGDTDSDNNDKGDNDEYT